MDKQELKNLDKQQLEEHLGLLREKLRTLRFKVGAHQLSQFHHIKDTKKTIARILTLLNKK